jgi:hypothetical protein
MVRAEDNEMIHDDPLTTPNPPNGPPTAAVCPVLPTWLSKGLIHGGKGYDAGPDVICRDM